VIMALVFTSKPDPQSTSDNSLSHRAALPQKEFSRSEREAFTGFRSRALLVGGSVADIISQTSTFVRSRRASQTFHPIPLGSPAAA
jgi:hypothetical protein